MVTRAHLLVAPLCLAALPACGSGGGGAAADAAGDDFDRQALLRHIGHDIVLPTHERFAAAATELTAALDTSCPDLTAAQPAWREAMARWQRAEMMVFGPAAMDGNVLRDQIYSWTVVSSCAVDQAVAAHRVDPEALQVSSQLTNRRGLDALEYLLFAPSLDHSCPSQTAPEGWNELPEADRQAARCAYAAAVAEDLVASAEVLVTAWSPDGGDFAGELERAGIGSAVFPTQREALNAIVAALFYVDTELKDMKLAQPAGLTDNACSVPQEPCPAELESHFAGVSGSNARENLVAFRWIFTGAEDGVGDEIGFDDLLIAVGAGELATQMTADLDAAIAGLDALEVPLEEALTSDYEQVVAVHAEVQALTTNFKSQFLTVLDLAPPKDVTDND